MHLHIYTQEYTQSFLLSSCLLLVLAAVNYMADETKPMPIGFKFIPTDEEVVEHYLKNKVLSKPIPSQTAIQEIDNKVFYSMHPYSLVTFVNAENEWYFFIYEEKRIENQRHVGDGLGFWKANGPEVPVSFTTVCPGVSAFKRSFTYFSTASSSSNKPANKTHWKMEEFRLEVQSQDKDGNQDGEWKVIKITRGGDYKGLF